MTPSRLLTIVAAVAAAVCLGAAFLVGGDGASSGSGGGTAALATPLWSPRRVPQPVVDAVGAQHLQRALDQAVAGTNACFVVDQGGAPLATRTADAPLIPASTEKLLTAASALAILGPDTKLETRALAPQAPASGSVDRLYLVGGGDPLLGTPEFQGTLDEEPETRGTFITPLAALADGIVNAGVKRIPGGIVADDSRYEPLRYLPTWKSTYRTDGQVGPLGALTVNRGFSVFKPKPVPVDDPALFAAQELTRLLTARGVSVGAPTHATAAPNAVEVAKVESAPMKDVVSEVLRVSDNLAAELLTREVGLKVAHQGTTVEGTKATAAKLAELGLPTANLTLIDGSGLDRGDRVTCQLLAATLNLGSRPEFTSLWSGLPVAGQTGTLVDELRNGPLTGRVRAKTGSLDGVTGLVGLVDATRPLRFAFVANGEFTEAGGIGLRARVAGIVAGFPDSPPADALVPAPVAGASPGSTTTTKP